ncbi:MAG: hypothetical protein P9M08_09625 [Candidatus Erginobacter occultus]|nr:hypothetical protein [Candidatus Erginobacter occultus]
MKMWLVAAAIVLAVSFPLCASSQTGFQVLHSFAGQTGNDGSEPQCTLVSDGSRLYGTTYYGGYFDYGTLFSLLPDGSDYRVLHHFGDQTDPVAGPSGVLVSDGSVLYGTASYGGSNYFGVVFSLQTDGTGYTELHDFAAYPGDGVRPQGGVSGDGTMLYGTTMWGGDYLFGGTVFAVDPNPSSASVLHSFPDFPEDGILPYAAPILASGVLYGTTAQGPEPVGTPVPPGADAGVLYSLQTDGSSYAILHTFGSQTDDGDGPFGGLLSDGTRIYGTTGYGGAAGYGTVFSLNPDGSDYAVLHSFALFTGDGVIPSAGLVSDATRLYGTATYGGAAGYYYGGTIFALNKDGSDYTILHDFSLQTDQGYSLFFTGLLLLDNTLYGMTNSGGDYDYGVIFSYTLPSPTPIPAPTPFRLVVDGKDYNGDGRDDTAVWRPASGRWIIDFGAPFTPEVLYFGRSGDVPASGDYDGDGVTDPAVFRPANGLWAAAGVTRFYFGGAGDIPVPADYSGDGFTDPGIFRPATGLWAVRGITRAYFGRLRDLPVPGDYAGTGTARISLFRPATGLWAVRGLTRFYYGVEGDYPVPADYSGDGLPAPAIFRSTTGLWAIRGVTRFYYGAGLGFPQPGDYSGTGTESPTVYRPVTGLWAVRGLTRIYWGGGDYVPVSW